ncbi:MAG: hypothetical protein H8E66_04780 [Planctomycetes bacterium]|nr:hypothetical protein [Planctomycetota bacterium]
MSTAAHEPPRIGPRRANPSPEGKVAPRRNAPQVSAPSGIRYDSDELPVLIRLPNLHDVASAETPPAATKKKRHRIDRSSGGKRKLSSEDSSRTSKKTFEQSTINNKLVLGGVVGGILLVVILFALNAGGPEPLAEQDGWASEDGEPDLLVQDPEISIPTGTDTPPLYPGFAYEAPGAETAQLAGGESEQAPVGLPYNDESFALSAPDPLAGSTNPEPASAWPSAETMGPPSSGSSTLSTPEPETGLNLEQRGYRYPTTGSSGQADYSSSIYPSETESYRMGMRDPNRPSTTQGDSGSNILDGNISIPDTRKIR